MHKPHDSPVGVEERVSYNSYGMNRYAKGYIRFYDSDDDSDASVMDFQEVTIEADEESNGSFM